jgi:hypothetical protein
MTSPDDAEKHNRYEHFLALLHELEVAIEHDLDEWIKRDAIAVEKRWERLDAKVRHLLDRFRGHH